MLNTGNKGKQLILLCPKAAKSKSKESKQIILSYLQLLCNCLESLLVDWQPHTGDTVPVSHCIVDKAG